MIRLLILLLITLRMVQHKSALRAYFKSETTQLQQLGYSWIFDL
jgi:hypothetical protein